MFKNEIEISVVVPVFNEQAVIEEFFKQTSEILHKEQLNYEIVFVDDGSRDQSYELLRKFKQVSGHRVKVVKLARNFGARLRS